MKVHVNTEDTKNGFTALKLNTKAVSTKEKLRIIMKKIESKIAETSSKEEKCVSGDTEEESVFTVMKTFTRATGKKAINTEEESVFTVMETFTRVSGNIPVDTEEERLSLAIPEHVTDAWVVVSEDFAREKCKQSLRDAAASLKKPAALTTSRKRSTSPIPEDVALEIESGASRKVARPSAAGVPRKPRPMTNTDKLPAEPDTAEILPPQSVHYSPSSRPSAFLQQEATLELSQDLSFRLKHPSHRKRDMPRLRRMQEQREAAAQPEASLLTGSLMKAEREPTRPARKRAIGQERSQYSTSSDSDNDLDQKPKACNQKN